MKAEFQVSGAELKQALDRVEGIPGAVIEAAQRALGAFSPDAKELEVSGTVETKGKAVSIEIIITGSQAGFEIPETPAQKEKREKAEAKAKAKQDEAEAEARDAKLAEKEAELTKLKAEQQARQEKADAEAAEKEKAAPKKETAEGGDAGDAGDGAPAGDAGDSGDDGADGSGDHP